MSRTTPAKSNPVVFQDSLKAMMCVAVQLQSVMEDPAAFKRYLVDDLKIRPETADSLLLASFSYTEVSARELLKFYAQSILQSTGIRSLPAHAFASSFCMR